MMHDGEMELISTRRFFKIYYSWKYCIAVHLYIFGDPVVFFKSHLAGRNRARRFEAEKA
jgi:hypothetical protein